MPLYRFVVQGGRASVLRTSTLPDDDCAWDYGETIIRALLESGLSDERIPVDGD